MDAKSLLNSTQISADSVQVDDLSPHKSKTRMNIQRKSIPTQAKPSRGKKVIPSAGSMAQLVANTESLHETQGVGTDCIKSKVDSHVPPVCRKESDSLSVINKQGVEPDTRPSGAVCVPLVSVGSAGTDTLQGVAGGLSHMPPVSQSGLDSRHDSSSTRFKDLYTDNKGVALDSQLTGGSHMPPYNQDSPPRGSESAPSAVSYQGGQVGFPGPSTSSLAGPAAPPLMNQQSLQALQPAFQGFMQLFASLGQVASQACMHPPNPMPPPNPLPPNPMPPPNSSSMPGVQHRQNVSSAPPHSDRGTSTSSESEQSACSGESLPPRHKSRRRGKRRSKQPMDQFESDAPQGEIPGLPPAWQARASRLGLEQQRVLAGLVQSMYQDSDLESREEQAEYIKYSDMIGHLKKFLADQLEKAPSFPELLSPEKGRSGARSPVKSQEQGDALPLADLVTKALTHEHAAIVGKEHMSLSDPTPFPVRAARDKFPKQPKFAQKFYKISGDPLPLNPAKPDQDFLALFSDPPGRKEPTTVPINFRALGQIETAARRSLTALSHQDWFVTGIRSLFDALGEMPLPEDALDLVQLGKRVVSSVGRAAESIVEEQVHALTLATLTKRDHILDKVKDKTNDQLNDWFRSQPLLTRSLFGPVGETAAPLLSQISDRKRDEAVVGAAMKRKASGPDFHVPKKRRPSYRPFQPNPREGGSGFSGKSFHSKSAAGREFEDFSHSALRGGVKKQSFRGYGRGRGRGRGRGTPQ